MMKIDLEERLVALRPAGRRFFTGLVFFVLFVLINAGSEARMKESAAVKKVSGGSAEAGMNVERKDEWVVVRKVETRDSRSAAGTSESVPADVLGITDPEGATEKELLQKFREYDIKRQAEAETLKCQVQNCHGADVECGFSKGLGRACTLMYQEADACRQFARCEVVDGECRTVTVDPFEECAECVESCPVRRRQGQKIPEECRQWCMTFPR